MIPQVSGTVLPSVGIAISEDRSAHPEPPPKDKKHHQKQRDYDQGLRYPELRAACTQLG